MKVFDINSTNQHSALSIGIARNVADYHCIKFDAERDAQDAQLVIDEREFVQDYLPTKIQSMAEDNESIDELISWMDLEFADFLSDKNHDRRG